MRFPLTLRRNPSAVMILEAVVDASICAVFGESYTDMRFPLTLRRNPSAVMILEAVVDASISLYSL